MVGRASHAESSCTLARSLGEIGDGWSLLIVRDAFDGLRRFGNSRKVLGLPRTSWHRVCRPWWRTASWRSFPRARVTSIN